MSNKVTTKNTGSRNPVEDLLKEIGIEGKNAVYVQNAIFCLLIYIVLGILIEGLAA